jgi:hypothetical protein
MHPATTAAPRLLRSGVLFRRWRQAADREAMQPAGACGWCHGVGVYAPAGIARADVMAPCPAGCGEVETTCI